MDEVERLMQTHAIGAYHLCQAVLPTMRSQLRGDIVMVSSVVTRDAPPRSAPYTMAKSALEALAFTIILLLFSRWFWKRGLRHYSGASA